MGPRSNFGSWAVESLETHANRRGEPATCPVEQSTVAQRPASATVRVPYLPSHVRTYQLNKPKRRPLSAASYMRSTFAIDSALPARATSSTPQQQQEQQRRRRFRGRASWQPETHPEDAKYVLQEDARQDSFHVSLVPRPRQGFGVRMPTAGKKRVYISGGGGGGRAGRAQPRNTGSNRGPARRPASAPVRFFGRRPVSSPGYESSAGPDEYGQHGDDQPRRATKRRPGSVLTGNAVHQNQAHDIQRYLLHDQRRGGSPLPSAAWGVRPTSAPSIPAGSFVAGCSEQIGRTYQEVVVCRGSHIVVKGSAARCQKQQPRHSSAGPDDQRQQDEGLGGIGENEPELLHGANAGHWVRGGRNQGGGDDVGGRNQLGLAINPSPWGAFVGGPPAEKTKLGCNRKRPSSAPRTPSTTTSPTPGLGVGSLRVQARPSSAHAASPSRNCATEVFVTTCYSCGKEDGSGSKAAGAERAIQNSGCRSSRSGWPLSVVDREELGEEETDGMDAGGPRQANRARLSQQRAATPGAGLVVDARQVRVCTFSPSTKSGLRCKTLERTAAPTFFGPSSARGTPYDAPSPPSLVQTPPPAPPAPARLSLVTSTQKVLGLFGSALLPAGSGTKLPGNWQNKRSELQAREQDRPHSQGRQQRKATSEVRTTKRCVERRIDGHSLNFAPVVLDRRVIGTGEENGLRHVRATGLVGKALRVPKHTSVHSKQQQKATTPSAKREEQRGPFFGLSQDQQSWPSGAQ